MAQNRRKLLRALALGGGAVSVAAVPTRWSKPVVDSVILPAHAQTTAGALFGSVTQDVAFSPGSEADSALPLDWLFREAWAGVELPGIDFDAYAAPIGDSAFFIQLRITDEFRTRERLEAAAPTSGARESHILDSLASPAHAGQELPSLCFISLVFEGQVVLNIEQPDGYFGSGFLNNLAPSSFCGPAGFTDVFVSMRLQGMENRTGPGFGNLEILIDSTSSQKVIIPISAGGSQLSPNCFGNPCTDEIFEK